MQIDQLPLELSIGRLVERLLAHLLVERSALETERVGNVVDGNGTVLGTVLGLLGRGVGT
jgi:hypothetical protein